MLKKLIINLQIVNFMTNTSRWRIWENCSLNFISSSQPAEIIINQQHGPLISLSGNPIRRVNKQLAGQAWATRDIDLG